MKLGWGWIAVIVVAGAAYVVFRMMLARSQGEDATEAGRRALSDALPVVGAGIAGVLIFFAVLSVVVIMLFVLFLALLSGGDGDGLGLAIVLVMFGAFVVMVGLPVGALVWVARKRRRERMGG